jgi:hypothetical protein
VGKPEKNHRQHHEFRQLDGPQDGVTEEFSPDDVCDRQHHHEEKNHGGNPAHEFRYDIQPVYDTRSSVLSLHKTTDLSYEEPGLFLEGPTRMTESIISYAT